MYLYVCKSLLLLAKAYCPCKQLSFSGIPTKYVQCAISGIRRAVSGNCDLLVYYSANCGNFYSLCNKPEERSFQVNTKLWVHCFACWLLTDTNGTAVILHEVHNVNKIIEIKGLSTDMKKWDLWWRRICASQLGKIYFWDSTLYLFGCVCCHLDYVGLENDTKEELICYLKGCKRIVDEVFIHFFCLHLVMTKRVNCCWVESSHVNEI